MAINVPKIPNYILKPLTFIRPDSTMRVQTSTTAKCT